MLSGVVSVLWLGHTVQHKIPPCVKGQHNSNVQDTLLKAKILHYEVKQNFMLIEMNECHRLFMSFIPTEERNKMQM